MAALQAGAVRRGSHSRQVPRADGGGGLAVTKCHYCAFYHTEVARLYGATDAEIEGAVHYARSSAGWSTYLNRMQVDLEQFKHEVIEACEHVRATHKG